MNDDLISRQAAIDALHMHLMYRMGTDSNKKRLDEWINNLPSAQSDCTDCIKNGGDWNCDHVHCHKGISIQPEIIRCKDCKYWKHDHTCSEHALVSPMCANEFCSRAEKRTDE